MPERPRSEVRQLWPVEIHLGALDDDVDRTERALSAGFQKIADQMQRATDQRRNDVRWLVSTILAAAVFIVALVAVIVQ
jgi:hypothetical protein